MSAEAKVAIIILAAGASTRMGSPKMLLPLDGTPIVRRIVDRGLASGASEVIVVVPPEDAAIHIALRDVAVVLVEAAGAPQMSTSIHAALHSLSAEITSAVIVLADMVHVTTAMLAEVVRRASEESAPVVLSIYDGVTAPPLAIPRRHFSDLLARHGDQIGKAFAAAHRNAAVSLQWPASRLRDVDTPDQYRDAQVQE